MKSFYTLLLASMVSLSVSAQNVDADKARAAQNKALRDSLSKATEVLAYHPDSINLRLKKAAWNIQRQRGRSRRFQGNHLLRNGRQRIWHAEI
jgi:hypothetical protein